MERDPSGHSLRADPFLREFLDRPLLLPHLQRVWTMFWQLSRRRPIGFSLGAIPLAEFHAYCQTFHIDDITEREWLFVRIDALDGAYLEHMHKKHEAGKS